MTDGVNISNDRKGRRCRRLGMTGIFSPREGDVSYSSRQVKNTVSYIMRFITSQKRCTDGGIGSNGAEKNGIHLGRKIERSDHS